MSKYLVVIPTYNERDNIRQIITEVLAQGAEYEILIVDDNSPDGTGQIALELSASSNDRVKVLQRAGKLGLASAYLEGFRYGLEQDYDYIFEMDADFSHQPIYLAQLLAAAQRSGVAVGSRNVPGGGVANWPWYRKFISQGGSLYARSILGLKVKDCTSGFKCFARKVLEELNLPEQIQSTGFGFQVEVNCLCEWNGYRVAEVPIIFPDRIMGKSKMSQKIFWEALIIVWRLQERRKQLQEFNASPALPEIEA